MESQVVPPQHGHHTYENDPQNDAGLHSVVESEDYHEKKSVLKRLKAKAKKLKDTITKHGQGHGHGHDIDHHDGLYNTADDHDLDEEEDDEDVEDMVEDPRVHGAPIHESAAIMSGVSSERPMNTKKDQNGLEGDQRKNKVNFGETTLMDDGIPESVNTPQVMTPSAPRTTQQHSGPTRTLSYEQQGQENVQNQPAINLASSVGLEKDAHALDSDGHHVPNYQSKVTDPTTSGGEEIDVDPVSSSPGKMNVNDETGPNQNIANENCPAASFLPAESHDQFSLGPSPIETEASRLDVSKEEVKAGQKPLGQRDYAEKISTATDAVATKAMAAKNLVASTLRHGDQDQAHPKRQEGSLCDTGAEQTGYTEKTSSVAVMSGVSFERPMTMEKNQYGFGGNQENNKVHVCETTLMDDGIQTPVNAPQAMTPSAPRTTQQHSGPTTTLFYEQQGKENDQNQQAVNLASPVRLEKDAHAADSKGHHVPNYQNKVTDPTGSGGKEIDVAPVSSSLSKMNVNDETRPNQSIPTENCPTTFFFPARGYDQFSLGPSPMENEASHPDVNKEEVNAREKPPRQGGYAEKISSPTAVATKKAMASKDLVASTLRYGNQDQAYHTQQECNLCDTRAEQTDYTEKISSTAVMSGISSERPMTSEKDPYGLEGNQGKNKVNYGETTLMDDGIQTSVNTLQGMTPSAHRTIQQYSGPTRTLSYEQQGKENDQNQPTVNLVSSVGLKKDAHAPNSEGHHVPNYQCKVTDPTGSGGKEIDNAPISSSLGKMNVNDEIGLHRNILTENHPAASFVPAESHDQFSLGPSPMETEVSRPDFNKEEVNISEKPPGQGGYAEKISTPTAAVAEKVMATKDLVASTLGYGDQDQAHHKQQESNLCDTKAEQTDYTKKISSAAVMSGISSERPITPEKDQYCLEGNQGENKVNFDETTLMDDGIRTSINTLQAMTPLAHWATQQHSGPTRTMFYEQQGKENDQNQPIANLAYQVGLEKDAHALDSEGHHVPNYQSNVTDLTRSGGKEIDVAPISSSLGKINVNDETGPNHDIPIENCPTASFLPTGSHDQFSPEPSPIETDNSRPDVNKKEVHAGEKPPEQGGYAEKISTTTASVAEEAIAAKDLVAPKLGYGDQDQAHRKQQEGNLGGTKAEQTGYTKGISSTATAIAEKAASAKDVMASKLWYGRKNETPVPETNTNMESSKPASPTLSPIGPKRGIVDMVTKKLTPMFAKVAGTSGIVTSKARESGSSGEVKEGASVQQDKGKSVKDYLGEKLKPGEEDKALSEMISSALHKRKEGEGEKGKVLGKVTESKEVREQLRDEKERNMNDDPREGVVEKLRGTVGSWFGKSEAASNAPESYDNQNMAKEEHSGERRLQESTY